MIDHPIVWTTQSEKDGSLNLWTTEGKPIADLAVQVRLVPVDEYTQRTDAIKRGLESALNHGDEGGPVVAQLRKALRIER